MNTPRFTPLSPRLARRMAPLALLTLCVMGGIAPWLYQQAVDIELKREARFMARAVATRLQQLVVRHPRLWAYYPQEIAKISQPFQSLGAHVECETIWGASCSPQPLKLHTSPPRYPVSIRQPIIDRRGEVGYVTVSLSQSFTNRSLNIWWFTTPLALLVAGLIFTLPWWSARSADLMNMVLWRRLTELNQTLEERVDLRTHELSEMNHRLLTVQEEERLRISRDLHDELGQTLTGLRLQLTCAELTNHDTKVGEHIKRALEVIDLGVDQVRRIAYEQRPPELDMLGLHDALHALVQRATQQGEVSVSLEAPAGPLINGLSNEVSVGIFRVIQEGITNALRHSGSSRIEVSITLDDSSLTLRVVDYGEGSSDNLIWGGGLSGVYGRLYKLQGTLSILRTPGGGLTLRAHIPLLTDT